MGSIAIPSSGRTHYVVIKRGNSTGAYITIIDMYNNVSQRLPPNDGSGAITIGGITYTYKGREGSSYKPRFSISKNGIIYRPVSLNEPSQPTKVTYNSGTVLTLGTDDASEPNVYIFSPN
jgi:hypothetical protein